MEHQHGVVVGNSKTTQNPDLPTWHPHFFDLLEQGLPINGCVISRKHNERKVVWVSLAAFILDDLHYVWSVFFPLHNLNIVCLHIVMSSALVNEVNLAVRRLLSRLDFYPVFFTRHFMQPQSPNCRNP